MTPHKIKRLRRAQKALRTRRNRPRLNSEWRALVGEIRLRSHPLHPTKFGLKVFGKFVTFVFKPHTKTDHSMGRYEPSSEEIFVHYDTENPFDATMTVVHELAHLTDANQRRYDEYTDLSLAAHAECLAQATEFAYMFGRAKQSQYDSRKQEIEEEMWDEMHEANVPAKEKKVRVRYFNWCLRQRIKEMYPEVKL